MTTRRRVTAALGALSAGAALSPLLPAQGLAQAAVEADVTRRFAAVSASLTGKSALDERFAQALLAAFRSIDPTFPAKLEALQSVMDGGGTTVDELHAALTLHDPALAALSEDILRGWYLGVVGSGAKAVCVAYESALSNRAVADVLVPPSFAYGAYGSWAAKPV